MLEISHSRSCIARACWMKYKWHYVDGYEPLRQSPSLSLGRIMHEAFDVYYKGMPQDLVRTYIITRFNDEISQLPLPDVEDLVVARYTALGMWDNYPYKDLTEFEDMASEEDFNVTLGKLRGVRYKGRIDGRVKKNGVYWVREFKTTGLSQRQFTGRVATSDQASGYVYAQRKMGHDVKGVMYDCIRKPSLYKRIDETIHDYGKRILQDYANKSKTKGYFERHYTYRNETELRYWEDGMVELVKEIRQRCRTGSFYRNTDACWSFNSECPYKKICFQDEPDPLTLMLFFKKN